MADWEEPITEERARLLEEVGRLLSGAGDDKAALRQALYHLIPTLADLLVLVYSQGGDDRMELIHPDPPEESRISNLLQDLLPAVRRLARRDMDQGRDFRWITEVSARSTGFLRTEPKLRALLAQLRISSLIVVPLRAGGRSCGGLALARIGQTTPFHAADLAFVQVVARRVAGLIQAVELHGQTVDEEKQRERLEAALDKWIRVFGVAGWGAAIVDAGDGRIEAVNPAFARMHGYASAESLTGFLFTDLLHPDRPEEPREWPVRSQQQLPPYESVHRRSDGTPFPVLTDVTLLEVAPGTYSYVVTIQDLTELKRAEERLRRAQRLEAVGRLAGGVAHEVNNMMTIILGFSDLLARSPGLPPERHREVEEIRKAATRAGKTTQQLLAFSRQQFLQPTDLQVNDVIAELLPALRLLLPANVLLETAPSPLRAVVHADRAQLEQVLINLIFNARDAMGSGGTLRLVTDSRWLDEETGRRLIGIAIPAGRYATISVIDTGHGMDPATVTQVFEPFFTTKSAGSGTGLGLATVYGIVKQSGGYVWVESTPGEGTTVTVCLPQVEQRIVEGIQNFDQADGVAECRSGTVLVVEDEEGVRDLARRVLEQQGHRVLVARDGPGAVHMLKDFGSELDLILSDVIVPEIASNDLQREVRRHRPGLPILYMSGYSRDDMVGRGLVPPDGPFLQKPFTAEELSRLVCQQLDRWSPVVGR